MSFVTMYKNPENLVAHNLLKMDNLSNHKLIIPKFHLLKLAELWTLKKKEKIEYRVQENMYKYLIAGFSYIGFFEKESDKEDLDNYIDNYLLNCSENMMTDLYDKMTNPKDGYAPFIVVELR